IDNSPLSPSTMTLLASSAVGATSAIRRATPETTEARTNSAPVRVLPKPRPARSSQTRQSPGGGNCSSRAQAFCQPYLYSSASAPENSSTSWFRSASGSDASQRAFNKFSGIFAVILGRFRFARRFWQHAEIAGDRIERGPLVVELDAIGSVV